ncbi:MAG: hypothetical protein OEY27_08935, partial [Gammaproteobacteria bacterium]|nr:hypothetical protein [Gammaproteobacteria bacterium]
MGGNSSSTAFLGRPPDVTGGLAAQLVQRLRKDQQLQHLLGARRVGAEEFINELLATSGVKLAGGEFAEPAAEAVEPPA